MEKFKKILPLTLVILLAVPTIYSLLQKGYFPMHDDTQPTRAYEMAQALVDGQFPVRWVKDLGYGYGYPLFNFYSPLPYYFGAVAVLLGFQVTVAAKIMFGVGLILAPISMYFLASYVWGRWGGVLAGTLYALAPYHGVDAYVRGAVGEYWAYGFLPLVLLGILRYRDKPSWGNGFLGALALAAVIVSHNITALILSGFLGLWLIYELVAGLKKRHLSDGPLSLIIILILGFSLAAFFWLPAIAEARYTKVDSLAKGSNDFHAHFVYPDQLWDSPWGYAGSAPGRLDGISFQIGKLQLVTGLIAIGLFFVARKKVAHTKETTLVIILGLLGFCLSVFFMLQPSTPVWELLTPLKYVQYPWRFLVFAVFFASLLGGFTGRFIETFNKTYRFKIAIMAVLLVLIVALQQKYFRPQFITQPAETDYISDTAMKWSISKTSDEYLPKDFSPPQAQSQIADKKFEVASDIMIKSSEIKSQLMTISVSAKNPAEIVVYTAYFPGWKVAVDAVEVYPSFAHGILTIPIDSGKHTVTVYFSDTGIRIVGNWISLSSVIVSCILLVIMRNTKLKKVTVHRDM